MSHNVALLKNIPITVLSKQVCFLLFYLCCEAKGTVSLLRDKAPHSTQWRGAWPAFRKSSVVHAEGIAQVLPLGQRPSIPLRLGVLVADSAQLNPIPRTTTPQRHPHCSRSCPFLGAATIPWLVNVQDIEAQLPCLKVGCL